MGRCQPRVKRGRGFSGKQLWIFGLCQSAGFGQDFWGTTHLHDFFRKLAAFICIEFANGVFDPCDLTGGNTELVQAQTYQQWGQFDVSSHFTANADADTRLFASLDGSLNES